jgi:hypothetical protein
MVILSSQNTDTLKLLQYPVLQKSQHTKQQQNKVQYKIQFRSEVTGAPENMVHGQRPHGHAATEAHICEFECFGGTYPSSELRQTVMMEAARFC